MSIYFKKVILELTGRLLCYTFVKENNNMLHNFFIISIITLVLIGISTTYAQISHMIYRPTFGYDGSSPNDRSSGISFSNNGRYVAFGSLSNNLVKNDNNGFFDCFLLDQLTHHIDIVNIAWNGEQANFVSGSVRVSDNGRYAIFYSWADNLVLDDTNDWSDIFVRDRLSGDVTRASVASDGTEGNGAAADFDITPDCRFIAFGSHASNMVKNDTNGWPDVFVHDMVTRETVRVSVSSTGEQGDYPSGNHAISADGRFVAFMSQARNLVDNDTNNREDVFVHDSWTGETEIVSISSNGEYGNGSSGWNGVAMSADGRYVCFGSSSTNLVEGDTNLDSDVFVHDRWIGRTDRVSISTDGQQGSGDMADISDDGRYVTFFSTATTFDQNDNNGVGDIYVHDRLMRTTKLVSKSRDGEVGNMVSAWPSISGNGRFIGFESEATNLVYNDTNGRRDVFVFLPIIVH